MLQWQKNPFCRECRKLDGASQSDGDNARDITLQKVLCAGSTGWSRITDGVCTMFQRTEFTSQRRPDDCPGSPTPCAEFCCFASCSECSMCSARFKLGLLETQTQSQLKVEVAASAPLACCRVELQEPSWKHPVPVSRFDDGLSRRHGTVRRSAQELRLLRMAERFAGWSSSSSCFLTDNRLYVCYRTKSRRSERVYRNCVT